MWKQQLRYLRYEFGYQVSFFWTPHGNLEWKRIAQETKAYIEFVKYERSRITRDVWFTVMRKYNWTCQLCGKNRYGMMEVDHIRPVSKWGTSDWTNLQVLCKPCNQKKGNRILS